MAFSAHKDKEQMKERFDSKKDFEYKIEKLAELVRESKHLVFFTGAGISTSTGIPDFRGPEGVWTLAAQGKKRTKATTDSLNAIPSKTHMTILKLQEQGICKYLISQNCDGLHRRSGIAPERISELHGNGNIEHCEECGYEYLRDSHCYRVSRGSDHYTGRHCLQPINEKGKICNGRLLESTVDFGQSLPLKPLQLAEKHSKVADLHIAMGSSLTVSPACNMPKYTATYTSNSKPQAGKLVIINLQNTPLDHLATLRIYATCDDAMEALMARLHLEIPPFLLSRYCKINFQLLENCWQLNIAGIEKGSTFGFEIPAAIFRSVKLILSNEGKPSLPHTLQRYANDSYGCQIPLATRFQSLEFLLQFMGHYNETLLSLPVPLPQPLTEYLAKFQLTYNPLSGHWSSFQNFPSPPPSFSLSSSHLNFPSSSKVDYNFDLVMKKVSGEEEINTLWGTSSLCTNKNADTILLLIGGISPSRNVRPIHLFNLTSQQWEHQKELIALCNLEDDDDDDHSFPFVRNNNRWGHSATAIDDREIYLFGGFDSTSQYNDLHLINSIDFTIKHIKTTGQKPSYRAHHSATFVPSSNSIAVFGGAYCKSGPYTMFSDLYLLNLSTHHWTRFKKHTNAEENMGETRPLWPSKRSQHCAVLINSKELAILGGLNQKGQLLNDIWIFNLSTFKWRKISTQLPFIQHRLQLKPFRVPPVRSSCSFIDVLFPSQSLV